MKSRLYWGLAILIVLLVGVSVVMLTRTTDFSKPIEIYDNPGELDISNPKFSEWMHKYQKASEDIMATTGLLMETGGSSAEEFMTNVDNMTDKEKKALVQLLRHRMKADQSAIKAYNKVMRDKPVK